ncbi:hypothetical protein [Crocosphaera sp. XPORK-15E]|uniref:hypothetical protein n=1 Tax=Crocosphaera sp. XPORK-15E TaxID=3110247 RepID=UPI002B1FE037|nr:hypothetical protein [Crocosphaera sp. XPORK-15E]MEA5533856.1 hypothetical protein [Crocosphaera sp. XPORK-15E]
MKTVQTLIIASLVTTVGLIPLPSMAQIKDNQVNALVKALKQAAPPNRPNDGMYSAWQVLPNIIPSWTKQCVGKELTPEQFEKDAKAAEKTVSCIVKRELNSQYQTTKNEMKSVQGVACWWMTGKYQGCDQDPSKTYVQRVLSAYKP